MFFKKLFVLFLVDIASIQIDEDGSKTTVVLVAVIGSLVGLVIMVAAGLVVIVYRCIHMQCVCCTYYLFFVSSM